MIKTKIIADSTYVDDQNKQHRVTTFELEYPRFIHSELKTHRVFSSNSASSRAIPIEKMISLIQDNPVIPMWTLNRKGMSGDALIDEDKIELANRIWLQTLDKVINSVNCLSGLGIHKQDANRLLEPFQHIKTILTGTDFSNFFFLRISPEAQPEIKTLATSMQYNMNESTPHLLKNDEVHCPYFIDAVNKKDMDKILTSVALCAQVSYRKENTDEATVNRIVNRLINSDRIHASPFEHICIANTLGFPQKGNLNGFVQLRHKIEEVKPKIDEWSKFDPNINYCKELVNIGEGIWL